MAMGFANRHSWTGSLREAFIEPVAVGQEMPDMPIFLDPAWYINVPLASAYESAWRGVPKPFQQLLDSSSGS